MKTLNQLETVTVSKSWDSLDYGGKDYVMRFSNDLITCLQVGGIRERLLQQVFSTCSEDGAEENGFTITV